MSKKTMADPSMNHEKLHPKKVGFYGGSFDPVHFGHINLALELLEAHQLDEVLFCPANLNPFKISQQPIGGVKHRLKMLELAIEGIPAFSVKDIEVKRTGPSYTLDTLKQLITDEAFTQKIKELYLILGDDMIPGFFNWYKPEEIIKLVPILVGNRNKSPLLLQGDPSICQALELGMTPTRVMEISSTEIRQRIQEKKYCGHLVPAKVLDYIYQNQLYFKP